MEQYLFEALQNLRDASQQILEVFVVDEGDIEVLETLQILRERIEEADAILTSFEKE